MATKNVKRGKSSDFRISYFWLRIVLGIIVAVEVLLAIGGLAGGAITQQLLSIFYGANAVNVQSIYLIKIIAVYMLTVAFMAMLAWRNPIRNKYIIHGLILLFFLRGLERIIFFTEVQAAFGLTTVRLIVGTLVYFIIAILLFVLKPRGIKYG